MDNKKEKCQKYESLFVFGDESQLLEHLTECKDCAQVHRKMQKVSALVKEVKPQFKREKKRVLALKTVCASFLLVFTFWGIGLLGNYTHQGAMTAAVSSSNEIFYESIINEWGFPVDEYGLLMAD